MNFFFGISQSLFDDIFEDYSQNARFLISKIKYDTKLSQFDRFNKRLKISWGMEIVFTDDLNITREDTRACYLLMLKMADLWFTFEHLVKTASDVIPKDKDPRSKVDFYQENTLEEIGFCAITTAFNQLVGENILNKAPSKRELYRLLAYLKNNTTGGTKRTIEETILFTKEGKPLQEKHIFSIAYGIRNIYVHEGVAAALGSKNYRVKRILYSILYDALILYSLTLGNSYCQKKLIDYD